MPYVAVDLETTGLDEENDEIIEVACVRFDATGVLDTYQSLVDPGRPLEYRIEMLTGLHADDLAAAPPFSVIAAEVERFIGLDPVVGQNPAFDIAFLARRGLHVVAPAYDTFELAGILLPDLREHSLGAIADHLGVEFPQRHRALPDADCARRVFVALRERLFAAPPDMLAEADRIASASDWQLRHFFREASAASPRAPGDGERDGMIHGFLRTPPAVPEPVTPYARTTVVPPDEPARLITSATARAALSEYEDRPQQVAMTRAVAETIANGDHLFVEAGTGVGKSLAYLVPSALHAARNGTRVVVSTNTINLQEQLNGQDLPVALRLLKDAGISEEQLRVAQLKGRANYLCLLRWAAARRAAALSAEEARVLVRMLFWLEQTYTGDRAELHLRREDEAAWSRLNAQDGSCIATQCMYVRDGSCFLYRARKRAEGAHVLIVNHALLLSDVAAGGNVIPPYQHLIVDEAHHLEDEATSQFGFRASESDLLDWLDRVHTRAGRDRDAGLAASVSNSTGVAHQAIGHAPQLRSLAGSLAQSTGRARQAVPGFFRQLRAFVDDRAAGEGGYDERVLISRAIRVQPDWADIEASWFAVEERLAEVAGAVDELAELLSQTDPLEILDRDAVAAETADVYEIGERLREGISRIIGHDDRETICWLAMGRRDLSPAIASAPLSVAERLRAGLFLPRESVVLTSATLSTDEGFGYSKGSLGLPDARELQLGSPFDYRQSTLLLTPSDMPEPNQVGYAAAIQDAIVELVRASEGRTLVLFTSHSALRTAYNGIKRPLEEQQILVLGQGIDGGAKQLLAVLRENHRTVVLGAASFWEGVDVTGEALSLLVVARLPFSVPSDPVFQARSELFDQPFEQYALPQAILRFKQGFGRLIRRRTDRGCVVVLDRRLRSKTYGDSFLRSLPSCTMRELPARDLPAEVAAWLARPAEPATR